MPSSLGILSLPKIWQAPMAGVQGSALTIAVCRAGGLGALPCAMLTPELIAKELAVIAQTIDWPYNVNFFCHTPPLVDEQVETRWRLRLANYYAQWNIDPATIASGAGRMPFNDAAAEILETYRPPVVSFHFGLPAAHLLARVKSWGSLVVSSATTVEEAKWLADHGVDAIIAQGLEAGGHRGMFLTTELTTQMG